MSVFVDMHAYIRVCVHMCADAHVCKYTCLSAPCMYMGVRVPVWPIGTPASHPPYCIFLALPFQTCFGLLITLKALFVPGEWNSPSSERHESAGL